MLRYQKNESNCTGRICIMGDEESSMRSKPLSLRRREGIRSCVRCTITKKHEIVYSRTVHIGVCERERRRRSSCWHLSLLESLKALPPLHYITRPKELNGSAVVVTTKLFTRSNGYESGVHALSPPCSGKSATKRLRFHTASAK
jgi:hypothetical protein